MMSFKPYDPKTKAAFLKVAADTRAAGMPWADVHAAAKAAGYTGTLKGITRMVEKTAPKTAPNAKPTSTRATTKKTAEPSKPVAKPKAIRVAKSKTVAKAKASKAKGGPGKRYTAAMKSAIMSAAIAARGAGKKWTEALHAAMAKGYRGSLQGIVKMIRASNRKKHAGRSVAKRKRPKAIGKVGRPKRSGKRLGRPPLKAISVNGFGSIQAAVDRIVRERVRTALDRAIAALQHAI
jgi:hypothetical protein